MNVLARVLRAIRIWARERDPQHVRAASILLERQAREHQRAIAEAEKVKGRAAALGIELDVIRRR